MEDYVKVFKALADHSRLKILSALNKEPMYQELLAERLNLSPSTVSFHLKKLETLNIITSTKEQYYKVYKLNKQVLNVNIMKVINDTELDLSEEQRVLQYKNQIISVFFKDGKLVSIPVQRKKREIILEELASHFELNKEYTEKEVNLKIAEFHDDFCTLRREFVMNKLFTRENMIYVRIK